ncbi:MAG: hypothetical protein SOV61_10000 [Lachnospiraceae bacterium]|nr:hypothetical protein [Lachnospiraceae bacterium]
MEKDYSRSQLEDKALKSATMYFGQELLPYLNVGKKIRRMLPTEQIRLEAVRASEDILFEMEDGTLSHFEFESVEITEDDLRRFRSYDAYTGMHYKKPVTTYVLCSGKVTRIRNELAEGMSIYRIIPLGLKQEDADTLIAALKAKAAVGTLTRENLAPLLLTPLMSGNSSIKDRILEAREIIGEEHLPLTKEDRQRMEAVLYAFACKFLENADLNEVKEELSMTVLGEMIWNDGLERGITQGMERGITQGIEALIETCKELGLSREDTMVKIESKFQLKREDAEDYMAKYWE